MTADAPKRPRSGYMIFGGEIREEVMEKVRAENLGLAGAGTIISERWNALSEGEKARYGEMSAQMKIKFDKEFAVYRQSDAFKAYMDAKAKLEAKQGLKKIGRTHLGEAPKKAPSAYSMYRAEVLPAICEENSKKEGEAKLDMAGLARKVSALWAEVPEEKKQEYFKKAEELRQQYVLDMQEFKTNQKYFDFLETREKLKSKENKELNLREMPKRPKNVFSLFADDHKDKVEPGKGEGKGRHALKNLWTQAEADKKAEYEKKEKELKDQWMQQVVEFKSGEKYATYQTTASKVRKEFTTEAVKVTTLKFLRGAPAAPPKSSFAVYVSERKRKREEATGGSLNKAAQKEEVDTARKDWIKLDRASKAEYETLRLEQTRTYEATCKEYMAQPLWQEYVQLAKRTKIPVKSLLFHKKKLIRKLKKGEKMPPSWIPVPKRPETFPSKPKSSFQIFAAEMKKQISDLSEITQKWQALEQDDKKKFEDLAGESVKQFEKEMQDFKRSDEGKRYIRELKGSQRRRRVLAAKNRFLDELPKKPVSAVAAFQLSKVSQVRKDNPGKKGFEIKQILQDMWRNLDAEERQKCEEASAAEWKQFEEKLKEFKDGPMWKGFQKAVRVSKPKAKGKSKSIASGPKKPASMPTRPVSAFQTFCKEVSGPGKSLGDMARAYKELDEEKRDTMEKEAKERENAYEQELDAWNKSEEGKKYLRMKHSFEVRRKLAFAKKKFADGEPKKPLTAFMIFCNEQRQNIMDSNPQLKPADVSGKLAEAWKNLPGDDRETWDMKEKEKKEEYEKELTAWKNSPNYKRYQAAVASCTGKTQKKKEGPVTVPAPENLPKKPLNGMQLFGAEQRQQGKSLGLKQLSDAWIQLQADGQKQYMEKASELSRQYDADLKEFMKTAEGKRYFRERGASMRKAKIQKAKERFLDGENAPKMPKRPPSAYFLFVQEKRSTITDAKFGEVAKRLTAMWNELGAEDKKVYEDKVEELKKKYEAEMAEFKNSADYKNYNKAVAGITGKRAQIVKAKAKAASAKAGSGRGRGGGRGGGAEAKKAGAASGAGSDDDSDSDVMGSDTDSSSSSDSD
eukprot:TRINITY_DN2460_c0_g1_i3.p1 TRINITY_DN2460_c0_g1~~TRINITY_DN2460_c0_g1_i3.p1  ORF type:complete len:1243 (+),score=339.34 TRINITY_DN2460_c0_g1_i3:500-3730(+)